MTYVSTCRSQEVQVLDLSDVAGFPLRLDPDTIAIDSGGGIVFQHSTRTAGALRDVLESPEAVPSETPVYHLSTIATAPPAADEALSRLGLILGLVLVRPIRIGREFAKTFGHYHPAIPGTAHGYPEVYTQYYGRLTLLLQKRQPSADTLADCVAIEMEPGMSATIPPGYAHVLINTTGEPVLLAGLYGRAFSPDYDPIRRRRGMAYYFVAGSGSGRDGASGSGWSGGHGGSAVAVERNPRYEEAPPLRTIHVVAGTPFASPEPGMPVWESFLRRPETYAFLTQAEAVNERYGRG
jgi:glucose-6-phosphate isomerase